MPNTDLLAERLGLDGQVAIITGAAAGICRETVRLFCEAGANVVLADQDAAAAESFTTELCAVDHDAMAVGCDVREENAVQQLIEKTIEHFGKINILVNCAGIFPVDNFLETSIERWTMCRPLTCVDPSCACARPPNICAQQATAWPRHEPGATSAGQAG